jgi:hypothetical protein
MHPLLLHQLADDSVTDRRRHAQRHGRGAWRTDRGPRPVERARVLAGGLLIAVGTRLAGTRPAPAALRHRSSVPS